MVSVRRTTSRRGSLSGATLNVLQPSQVTFPHTGPREPPIAQAHVAGARAVSGVPLLSRTGDASANKVESVVGTQPQPLVIATLSGRGSTVVPREEGEDGAHHRAAGTEGHRGERADADPECNDGCCRRRNRRASDRQPGRGLRSGAHQEAQGEHGLSSTWGRRVLQGARRSPCQPR
jgi:hypothetical protein